MLKFLLAQGMTPSSEDEVAEIRKLFENECNRRKAVEAEVEHLKCLLGKYTQTEVYFS